jgi:hypothetical protein
MKSGLMPGAEVAHAQPQAVAVACQRDLHDAAVGRELDGIGHQVPEDLLVARRVQPGRLGGALDVGLDAAWRSSMALPSDLDGAADQLGRVDPLALQPQLARVDARDVQDVRDDARLRLDVALDRVQPLQPLGRGRRAA